MKKILKNAGILAIISIPQIASAQIDLEDESQFPAAETLGLTKYETAGEIATPIFNAVLGLVGVISLAIMVYGGFRWMTSAGNEETIGEAKRTLIAGTIGLVVILISWSIVYFIINSINPSA